MSGLSYGLHYRETYAPTCTEDDLIKGYSPQPAYSGGPAGFTSTCFYSSKVVKEVFVQGCYWLLPVVIKILIARQVLSSHAPTAS